MELTWVYHTLHVVMALLLLSLQLAQAAKDKQLYCSACRAIVDEMIYGISKVDPKKTIQIGSFRVDPNGNQKLKEVPLARSEVHLTEMIESICDKMADYAQSMDKETGRMRYVRMNSRDGKGIELSNINISGALQKGLKFACETFVEDHEEEIINLLRDGNDDIVERKMCIEEADVCDPEDLLHPLVNKVDLPKTDDESDEPDIRDNESQGTNESPQDIPETTTQIPEATIDIPQTHSTVKEEL